MTASWMNKSTSTRTQSVRCERHEVQSRRSQDMNPQPSDPESDTLPLDNASSVLIVDTGSSPGCFFKLFSASVNDI